MSTDNFAQEHGFETFEKMLTNSQLIIYDHGIRWMLTQTSKGWFAWIFNTPNEPLGYFKAFDIANNFILDAFKMITEIPKDQIN